MSSYFLMYGGKHKLPIDLYCGTQVDDLCGKSNTEFAQQLRERLGWAYKVTQ